MGPDEKKCPDCAEVIKLEARVCKHCGMRFQGGAPAPNHAAQRTNAPVLSPAPVTKAKNRSVYIMIGVLVALVATCSVALQNAGPVPTGSTSVAAAVQKNANLTPQQKAEIAARNAEEIKKVRTALKATPRTDIESNLRLYNRLAELDPANTDYTDKASYYDGIKRENTDYESHPEKALDITTYSWSKGGFGSVMLLRPTIKNKASFAIKDFTVHCEHHGPSGTEIDENTRVVYEVIPAQSTKHLREVNMGFINSQVATSSCEITDAARA